MSLTAGIVGLPNVGKSTLFNAITKNNILIVNTSPILVFLNNAINWDAKKKNTNILPILLRESYR